MLKCLCVWACASVAGLSVTSGQGVGTEPRTTRPGLVEKVETRLLQVSVSVLDPKGSAYASVPGLAGSDFVVRVDGKPLSAEQQQRLVFDTVCSNPQVSRPVIVVIDFNYVDQRGRALVADALDQLATDASDRPEVYKIYSVTRQTRVLTEGFSKNPQELHAIAALVRDTGYRKDEPAKDLLPAATKRETEVKKDVVRKISSYARQASVGG